MIITSAAVSRVCTAIKEIEKKNNYDVIRAYSNNIKPVPVTNPIVAVSLKKSNVGERKIVIDDSGEEVKSNYRDIEIIVSVDIYLPYAYDEALGIQIFDEIAHHLFNSELLEITKASCEDLHYDSASQTNLMRSSFTVIVTQIP